MKRVRIKYRALSEEHEHMPEFMYNECLEVVEENNKTVTVIYHNNVCYKYKFKKKYIESIINNNITLKNEKL